MIQILKNFISLFIFIMTKNYLLSIMLFGLTLILLNLTEPFNLCNYTTEDSYFIWLFEAQNNNNTLLLYLSFILLFLTIFNKTDDSFNFNLLLSKRKITWNDNEHVVKRPRLDLETEDNTEYDDNISIKSLESEIPSDEQLPFLNEPLPSPEELNLFEQDDIHLFLITNYFNIKFSGINNLNIDQVSNNIISLVQTYISMGGRVQDLHLANNIENHLINKRLYEVFGAEVFSLDIDSDVPESNSGSGSDNGYSGDNSSYNAGPPAGNGFNFTIEKILLWLVSILNLILEMLSDMFSNF